MYCKQTVPLVLFCFTWFNGTSLSNEHNVETKYPQVRSSLLYAAKNIGYIYGVLGADACAHEAGHAALSLLFYKKILSLETHQPCPKPFITTKGIPQKIAPLSSLSMAHHSRMKHTTLLAGGPLAGMATGSLILAMALKHDSNHESVSYYTKLGIALLSIGANMFDLVPVGRTDGRAIVSMYRAQTLFPYPRSAFLMAACASLGTVYAITKRYEKKS